MTDLVMTYTINPISSFFKKVGRKILVMFEITGRARAARTLANLGYYEEAKKLMLERTTY